MKNKVKPARNGSKMRAKRRMIALIGKCMKCGKTENLTIDHILPLSMGGSKAQSNWQVLCFGCNLKKGMTNTKYYQLTSIPL